MDYRVRLGRLLACAGASVLLSGQSVPAPPEPDLDYGTGLFETCTSTDLAEKRRCLAYVDGFVSGAMASSLADQRPRQFCPPEGTTMGRLRDTVVDGLQKMPEHRELPAYRLVHVILIRAYPCRSPF